MAKESGRTKISHGTFYRTAKIDGLSIFYREAGAKDMPTLLLLHGLPSSSRMFEPLFARLADRYHLIAPDYPGFDHSDWPDPKKFAYTFDHIAEIMNHFAGRLGLSRYTLYMQDYGVPVGFRMALAHPERVEALIVQDGVTHNEGLGVNWLTSREFWKIARRTRRRFAPICFRSRPQRSAMSPMIPPLSFTIRIYGPTNTRSLTRRGKRRFKAICSTITVPTWTHTRSARGGCR